MANYTIDSVEEAIGLLLLIARNPGLGVTDLAHRSGNTKARTFRMLQTLEKGGLLHRDGEAPTYTLGYNALYIGVAAESQISLARVAKHHLRNIGTVCNENVQVRIRDGYESVCIARWASTHHITVHTEIGNRRPLYVGASGKILLAYAPDDVKAYVLRHERMRFTEATLVTTSALRQAIKKIQQTGFTISQGEMAADSVAIAAPIHGAKSDVVAAISIAGPATRLTEQKLPYLKEQLLKAALEISIDLGYQ